MSRTTKTVVLAVVLIAVVVVLWRCRWTSREPDPGPSVTWRDPAPLPMILAHDEATCDMDGPDPLIEERLGALSDTMATWNTWRIPEYQDTQRFVESPASGYGPLACIVASPRLGDLGPADFAAPNGAVVAVIYLHESTDLIAYRRLKLSEKGFYCVVLKGDVTTMTMEGHVVRALNKACGTPGPATRLTAFPHKFASVPTPDGYPEVATFVILNSWMPGIGVRCYDRWCGIGIQAITDVQSRAHAIPSTGAAAIARHTVMGWYDQQELALVNPGFPPVNLKATLKASIVPVPALGTYDIGKFEDPAPTEVAQVYLDASPTGTKYQTRWLFTRTGPNNPNTLSLQKSTAGVWTVFVNGAANPNLRVIHNPHSVPVPGTARWKWSDRDEMLWVRCGEGCCSVEEI